MEGKMYRKEIRIVVSSLSTLLILILYSLYVYNRYVADNPDILNNLRFWGKAMVYMAPVMIVAQIVIHIIYAIINKIVTDTDIPVITDEMDKLIELKALRISHWVFTLGFFLSMILLATGARLPVFFLVLIVSGFISSLAADMARIIYYRKGV
jgi:hypothetical protein